MTSKFEANVGRGYFEQEIQPNIYCGQADSLQWTLTNIISQSPDIPKLGWDNLRDKFKRRILIY